MPRLKDGVTTGGSIRKTPLFLRVVGWVILGTFFVTQTFVIPVGRSDPARTKIDIVALVVGEGTWNNEAIRDRIKRYAQDIQHRLPWTRTEILLSASDEPPARIANTLESLYFEGEEGFDGLSQLTGVVLIGDVPLPVVEQDGHPFESVYPYTDFLDKVFIRDASTGIYKQYPQAPRQQAEIWHGIIRAPQGSGNGHEILASFFDKNHAYYARENGYADFDRKVFFADLVQEPSRVGAEGFLPYQLFLEHLEDIVYERYTSRLLEELTRRMQGSMDALLKDQGIDIDSATALKDLGKVPDQYTKQPIEQMLRRFIELLGAYTGEVADVVAGSGRWTERDADTFARRITLRDEAGAQAMKAANERLSTFEQPVNLFAIDASTTRTLADAKAQIERVLSDNALSPTLLATDGLYDVVTEALVWRTYRIADKYRHVLQEDLTVPDANKARSPFAGNGYESAYFVLDPTSRDTIQIPRLQDGLFSDEDAEFEAAKERIASKENETMTQLGTLQAIAGSGMGAAAADATKDACGSFEDGVPLPQWFPAIMCWLRNLLPPKINFKNDGRGSQFSLKDNKPVFDPLTDDATSDDPIPTPAVFVPAATFLRLETQESLAVGGAEAGVTVEVLDQRHEPFAYDGPVALRITLSTSAFGTVPVPTVQAQGGRAQFSVRSSDLAGEIHLIASLADSALGVASIRTYSGEDPSGANTTPSLALNALYVTIAGVDAGARDSTLAERILYSPGKTQAVTTLMVPERMGETLLTVGPDGTRMADDAAIEAEVRSSSTAPLTIHFTDENLGTTVADVRYHLPPSGKVSLEPLTEGSVGIVVRDVSEDDHAFSVEGNDVTIREEGQVIGRIRPDGTMDLSASLHLEKSEDGDGGSGTVLELLEGDRVLATITLLTAALPINAATGPNQGAVTVSVPSRLYDTMRSGPYVSVYDASERSETRHTFASLNNRSEEAWSGWRGDFINEILFAAGNTVGESVRHNASASVVTLGDPVIALDNGGNAQTAGYGKDVGQVVAEIRDSRISQVVTADYNHDGLPDILVNREDGELHLYQNYNQGTSYKDMGTLIVFSEKMAKLLPVDVDGDGWVDLIGLKNNGGVTSFINTSGAFHEAPSSPFAYQEALIVAMDAADFDGDGRTDVVTMDRRGALQVWFGRASGFESETVKVDMLTGLQGAAMIIERNDEARPNILISRPEEGKLVRYFPIGNGRTFEKRVSDIPAAPTDPAFVDADGNGVPDQYDVDVNRDGIPDVVEQQVRDATSPRGNRNQSAAFNLNTTLDSIDSKIDDVMQNLCPKKSGGCPAIFGYNKAFFAPGYDTIVGPLGNSCTQGPLLPGKPVISLPPIVSQFRLYVMPTLTGGVGIAACFGPKFFPAVPPVPLQYVPLLGNCFVRSFNPLTQACSGLSVLYDQLWSSARGIARGAGGVSLFQVGIGAKEQPEEYDNGTFTDKTKKFNNVRPKAFPAFIMTWVERQVEEIVTKLTDLPSITLILPEFSDTFVAKDLKGNEQKRKKEVKYVGDALDYLNSLPFLNIKVEDVNVKYPALPKSQMKLMKEYYEQWIKDAEEEIKSFTARADIAACLKGDTTTPQGAADACQEECEADPDSDACFDCEVDNGLRDPDTGEAIEPEVEDCSIALPKLSLRIAAGERTIQRVKSNLARLQDYADFPQTIEKLVNYKTEIIRQTTRYLDRIANYMGGYYLRNKLRVVKWQETYRLIKAILKGWQLLPDIFTQYRNACTTCRNDRGNYMDCRMTIWKFVLAPIFNNLPIIPFPKWPDIVVDVSNINAVVDIHIPSPHFIPQPVVLPKPKPFRIPDIDFETGAGDFLSDQIAANFEKDLDLNIPKLPALPQVPDFLPKLPNLPLPQLPDIPPPPKIPKIAGALTTVLKVGKIVLKVWCLYKKGIPLIPEQNVKGVVEYQTERSNFIKPDFLDVFIPEPKLPYVDQIRVDAFVNFTFNVDALRTAMAKFVQPFNRLVTNLTRTAVPLHQVLDSVPQLPDEIRMGSTEQDKQMAQAETEAYETLLEDSSAMMDTDAFRAYYAQQLKEANEEEPLFDLGNVEEEPVADLPVENERVVALKATLEDLQRESDEQLKAMREVLDGGADLGSISDPTGLFRPGNVILANAMEEKVSVERGTSRDLAPRRTLALLDEAAPIDGGGGGGTITNEAWSERGEPAEDFRGVTGESAPNEIITSTQDLYLYDPVTRTPERLVAYSGEEDVGSVVDSADMDGNGETDVVYNLGSTILVKRNLRSPTSLTYFNDEPPVRRVADNAALSPSVNYVRTTDGYRFSGMFWNYERDEERIGYRLSLRPVINSFDRERSEGFTSDRVTTAYFALPGSESLVRQLAENDPRSLPEITVLDSPTADSAPLHLQPGTYYGRFQSVSETKEGKIETGTANELHIVVARSENKTEQPVAVIAGGNYRRVPILQATVLDARLSYKTGGMITTYAWDLHPETDTNGDGVRDNDPDAPTSLYAPIPVATPYGESIVTLGAFFEPGPRRVVLTVTDDAGNTAKTDVILDVFVPDVLLDEVSVEKGLVGGHLEPEVADEPVTVLRDRGGTVTVLRDSRSDPNGQQRTDVVGKFTVEGLSTEKGIEIKGVDGKRAVLIDPAAHTIMLSKQVSVRFEAADANRPTRLDLYDGSTLMGWVSLAVSGGPLITDRVPENIPANVLALDAALEDAAILQEVPSTSPAYPGGVMLYDRVKRVLFVSLSTDGNLALNDPSIGPAVEDISATTSPVTVSLSASGTVLARLFFPWSISRLP